MHHPLYGVVKIVGIVVIVLMASAMIYAMSTSIAYWSGIGV